MSDSIVERLREIAAQSDAYEDCNKGADLIEKLQAENAALRPCYHIAKKQALTHCSTLEGCWCFDCECVDAAKEALSDE